MRLKIKNIFAALLVVSALSSCEDALDKFPLDSLSPETFFSNESELQAYANNFYGQFPGTGLYNEQNDMITNYQLDAIMMGSRDIASGSWSWNSLRHVNTLIEYSVNCKDEAVRTKFVALARFFRAYFYFQKVKMFGDVPWIDKTLGSDAPELCRSSDRSGAVRHRPLQSRHGLHDGGHQQMADLCPLRHGDPPFHLSDGSVLPKGSLMQS